MVIERGFQRAVHVVLFPDYEMSAGTGSTPYEMLHFQKPQKQVPPFVVAVDEHASPYFETLPISPIDVSVLLGIMKAQGVEDVVITSPLSWQGADPFALSALETASAALPRCITTTNVTRSPVADPIPPALLRASISLSQVSGNFRTLPVVNRLAMSDTFLGLEKTWAGFSQIESEQQAPRAEHLLARWDDRIILSTSFLSILLREKIDPTELQVEVGHAIISPRSGHWWAIDEFGRYTWHETPPLEHHLSAAELFRPEEKVIATLKNHTPPLLFAPQRSEEFHLLQNLLAAPILLKRVQWQRLYLSAELTLMALLASLIAWIMTKNRLFQIITVLALIALCATLTFSTATWIPLSPLLLGLGVAYFIPAIKRSAPATLVLETPLARNEAPAAATKKPRTREAAKKSEPITPKPKQQIAPTTPKKKSTHKRSKKK